MPLPIPNRREQVVAEARSRIGEPWAHQQRGNGHGTDCAGLVTTTGTNCGLTTFDIRDYDRQPDGTLLGIMRRELVPIPIAHMQPGDVVALAYNGQPMHIGIVGDYRHGVGNLSIIHADNKRGFVVEHRIDMILRNRIVAAFAYPGIDE